MAIEAVAVTCLLIACAAVPVEGHTCASSGFGGCECNILGACNMQGQTVSGLDNRLTGYAPSGIEQFAYNNGGTNTNLAYLCEGNTVAILYDCNARIPLYAATMMTGAQLSMTYKRPNGNFKQSHTKLDRYFQQTDADYKDSLKRNICYETRKHGKDHYLVDNDWYRAARKPGDPAVPTTPTPCLGSYKKVKSVHKGHLIAARYGRGYDERIKATFTYTNVVPQFGIFNSGQWNSAEGQEVRWSERNCANYGGQPTRNARIYIVVGAIPSTYGTIKQRFFGQSGFSDYQSWSQLDSTYKDDSGKKKYRVNVPRYMWTAVCCTFQYPDGKTKWRDGVKSTTFFRENEPGKEDFVDDYLFDNYHLKNMIPMSISIFSKEPACNNWSKLRAGRKRKYPFKG